MKNNPKIFDQIEQIAPTIPAPLSWGTAEGITLGVNPAFLNEVNKFKGHILKENIIGKKIPDAGVYSEDVLASCMQNISDVVKYKKILTNEEWFLDPSTGTKKYFLATRGPLFDDAGKKVVGIITNSIEITAEKEAARLRAENELLEKFRKTADHVAHDVCSPINGIKIALNAKEIKSLPEQLLKILLSGVNRLEEIANTFKFQYGDYAEIAESNPEPFLVSLTMLDLITEKKYEYKNRLIRFTHDFDADYLCIKAEPMQFKRMLSSLINNAVETIGESQGVGQVDLAINEDANQVIISITDNGTGVPKKTSSGINLPQIQKILTRNHGKMTIDSAPNKGTTVKLFFPKVDTPAWVADRIKLSKDDTILVLDDDPSVHTTWDLRFKNQRELKIEHFTDGEEVINFVSNSSAKDKLLLLANHELLKQKNKINGLDIIKSADLKRKILVTSYYAVKTIRDRAYELNVKILPSKLVEKIIIDFSKN